MTPALLAAALLCAATQARGATGGPDAGGYMWDDSYPYNWYDASVGGTSLGGASSDDVNWPGIPLGFTFTYYGVPYTSVNICSNGWLSFTDATSTSFDPTSVPPDPAPPNAMVALRKEDLFPDGSSAPPGLIFHKQDNIGGLDVLVVEWRNVRHYGAMTRYYAEVILRSDDNIVCLYNSVSTSWTAWPHALGIENQTGLIGLDYPDLGSCPPNCNRAVRYYPGAPTATPGPATATGTVTATPTQSHTPTRTRTTTPTRTGSATRSDTFTRTLTTTPTLASGGEVAAWPNPFTPARHGVARFANVPLGSRILIYSFVGDQVRRFEKTTSPQPTWDGKNDGKERVRAGAYLYVIVMPGGKRVTGTLYVREGR